MFLLQINNLQKLTSFMMLAFVFLSSCSKKSVYPLNDFEAKTLNGSLIKTQELRGKIIVISLWATWCGPCLKEIPQLNKLASKFENDNEVVFLAITDDSSDKIKKFLTKRVHKYTHITGAKQLFKDLHQGVINTIPTNIIIDKKGNIQYYSEVVPPNISEVLADKIRNLKEEKPTITNN